MMKLHRFTDPTAYANIRNPLAPMTMHLPFADFQKVYGGGWLDEAPAGYRPPHPGFALYRTRDGGVLALQVDD